MLPWVSLARSAKATRPFSTSGAEVMRARVGH